MPEASSRVSDAAPPLVFISYSHKDVKLKERLRLFLKPAESSERIAVWDDRDIDAGKEWSAEIRASIERARVAVLLISPDYLASEWVTEVEAPHLLELRERSGLRIVPILLRPCNWMQVTWLRQLQMVPRDGKPISTRTGAMRDKLFDQAANIIVDAATSRSPSAAEQPVNAIASAAPAEASAGPSGDELTVDALADDQMSDEAQGILRRARVLATFQREQSARVTTSCLLFAIAEGGRDGSKFFRTPQFLWRELGEHGPQRYREAFNLKFPHARSSTNAPIDFDASTDLAQLMSANVLSVFRLASDISTKTVRLEAQPPEEARSSSRATPPRPGAISARHLLAALLLFEPPDGSTGASAQLSALGVDAAQLRQKFLDFVIKSLPDDDHGAWRTILLETSQSSGPGADTEAPAEPTTPATEHAFQVPLPGFLTDYWQGEDLLGITPDVNALASLIAAWSVEPPLSIGLFGEWGSGKTHFMRQLKGRVEDLSREARRSTLPQNAIGYYKNIVQIEFNAWHYIEGNLWASLVEHIFAHLKFSDQEDKTLTDARRETLMEKLGVKKEVQAKAEERKAQLKAKETQARDRASDAKSNRDDTAQALRSLRDELTSNVLNQLNIPIEFSPEQQALLKQLGVSSSSLTSAAAVQKQYLEAKGLWHRVRAQWNLFKTDPKRWRRWAVALALLAIPPLVGLGLAWFYQALNDVYTYLASAVTFLLTLLVAAKPYWEQVRKGVAALQEKADAIEQERQKRILELETELNVVTQQYKEAEREAETINRQVQQLETEIAGTTASKILAEFIEDRAAASDYRRHLGVLALIRRDFEQLAALFGEQRAQERTGNGAKDDKTINRIILYIDDLDRCPPERVVQVLQAIHLLLAFPLFVVVVGVDARWVIRSLQESYEWLRAVEDEEEDDRDDRPEPSEAQTATPLDYLEKIFQIPFWLNPMEDAACKTLLEGLTRDSREDGRKENGEPNRAATAEVKTDGATTEATARSAAAIDRPAVQQAAGTVSAPIGDAAAGPSSGDASQKEQAGPTSGQVGAEHVAEGVTTTVGEGEGAGGAGDQSKDTARQQTDDQEPIDLAPQSLKLSDAEINYMKELTQLIGRSPRAVKRFLNCYRLIRVGLRPTQMARFLGEDGRSAEFKAVMILLGVITGAPGISLYFIEELEKYLKAGTTCPLQTFLNNLDEISEINTQPDWQRVKGFLESQTKSEDAQTTLAALSRVAARVSRYSFRAARAETAGMKKREPVRGDSGRGNRGVKNAAMSPAKPSALLKIKTVKNANGA